MLFMTEGEIDVFGFLFPSWEPERDVDVLGKGGEPGDLALLFEDEWGE